MLDALRRWFGAVVYGLLFVGMLLYAYFPYLLVGQKTVDVASRPAEQRRTVVRGLATLDGNEATSFGPFPLHGPGARIPFESLLDPPPWVVPGLESYFDVETGAVGFFDSGAGGTGSFGGK